MYGVTSLQVLLIVVNRVACLGPTGRGWLVFKVLPDVLIVVNCVACLDPTSRGWLVIGVLLIILIVVNRVACLGPNRRGWLQRIVPFCGGMYNWE